MALRSSWPSSLVMASSAANAGNQKTTPNARLSAMIVVLSCIVLPPFVILDVTAAAQQLPLFPHDKPTHQPSTIMPGKRPPKAPARDITDTRLGVQRLGRHGVAPPGLCRSRRHAATSRSI